MYAQELNRITLKLIGNKTQLLTRQPRSQKLWPWERHQTLGMSLPFWETADCRGRSSSSHKTLLYMSCLWHNYRTGISQEKATQPLLLEVLPSRLEDFMSCCAWTPHGLYSTSASSDLSPCDSNPKCFLCPTFCTLPLQSDVSGSAYLQVPPLSVLTPGRFMSASGSHGSSPWCFRCSL